ncbi:MAG TPA: F0F1 ATP synthase subunit delta [Dehalococcoidia bacterium]|nr:F0F1 ATP synthase subunit delta [Dehalococcoidia bacterium]
MIRDVAAKRYAEAALLLAREEGKLEAWSDGLAAMAALAGDPQAQRLLESTRVSLADKASLVDQALRGVEPLALNLARLLLRRGRIDLAPQIAEAFQELLDDERGISHAVVTTAVPLSQDEVRAVAEKLAQISGRQVIVETQVDESILGGLVARIGDRLIDGSTRSRLQALKRQMAGVQR